MCVRCLRGLLWAVGGVLLFAAVFPVFAMIRLPQGWETGLVAAKLVMLPVGAICLMAAALMRVRQR